MEASPPPRGYEKTSVLFLGWGEEEDDTESYDEVRAHWHPTRKSRQCPLTESQLLAVGSVLEGRYGFETRLERMNLQTHPQVQAVKHVADFVFEADDPEHLLIVYYSGHGVAGINGRLLMHGSHPKDDNAREMYIDWTDVETTLGKARADVLVILDCCCAGVLHSRRAPTRSARRKLQYIAACRADQVTTSAGKDSFSRATIKAFRSLAEKPGFTTSELVRTLTAYEDFPREEQEVLIFDGRFGPVDEDIWIAPLTETAANDVSQERKRQRENGLPTADFLDLRFRFATHGTDADIEATAEALKKLVGSTKSLHFHRISLLRRKSHITAAIRHWRSKVDEMRDAVQAGPGMSNGGHAAGPDGEPEGTQNTTLLGSIGRVWRSVIDGRGAVPAWHDTPFVVSWWRE